MKGLNKYIKKYGFDYHQEVANDFGYIYRQVDEGKIVAFEVFQKKENKKYDCISFPGPEAFGFWAWSCRTLEDAKKRLESFKKIKENG